MPKLIILALVCASAFAAEKPAVPAAEKQAVMKAYNELQSARREYELFVSVREREAALEKTVAAALKHCGDGFLLDGNADCIAKPSQIKE